MLIDRLFILPCSFLLFQKGVNSALNLKFEEMSLISPKYQLDLHDRTVSIKAPVGLSEKESNERFEKSLDLFHIGHNFEEEGE